MKIEVEVPDDTWTVKLVPKLIPPATVKCDICERTVAYKDSKRAQWLTGFDGVMCFWCFSAWYDGNTNTEDIRKQSLADNSPRLDWNPGSNVE